MVIKNTYIGFFLGIVFIEENYLESGSPLFVRITEWVALVNGYLLVTTT